MNPRIAIASPNLRKYSETFIHGHIDRLPNVVGFLWGGYFPENWVGKDGSNWQFPEVAPKGIIRRLWRTNRSKILADFLKKQKITAILAEYGPTGMEIGSACMQAGIPLVVHFHGYDAFRDDMMVHYRQRYLDMFEKARALVVVSKAMEQQLIKLKAPAEKIVLNPYGIRLEQFKRTKPSGNPPNFLMIGRLVPKKAPDYMLRAFAIVLESVPEAKLTMIGDGPMMDHCKMQVKALGIAEKVNIAGVKTPEEIAEALFVSRCVVLHSMRAIDGDSEGTPLALMEAGASNLPVVSTYHAGIPDLIIHGETGLLVKEGDVEGMAQAMIRMAKEPGLADAMGNAAYERIAQHYSEKRYFEGLIKLLT